jgi:outer membrane immunogenic protein
MTKGILTALALVALGGTALAADLPARKGPVYAPIAPIFTWTGFYVGVNAGIIFSDNDITTSGNAANTAANVAANRRAASLSNNDEAFTIGGQIGYNYQFGNIVFGVETDLNYTDRSTSTSFLSALGDPSTYTQELDYLGTVRLRIGYAFDRILVYATGGLAYGDVNNSVNFFANTAGNPLQFAGRSGDVEVGYAVGGGIEYAFTNNLSLKAEYLYYDLGKTNVLVNAIPGVGLNSYTAQFKNDGHIVRAGLNYRFSTF